MGAVRVGVVGVGNCAAPLVQRVHHYRDAAVEDRVPGLMHVKFGDYEYQVDVRVSYLPVGSEQADKHYVQCAIDAGVGFVNALRVFIASDPIWARKFSDAGVSIVGDDVKSQVGATITHRVLAKLFEDRGVKLERTYQLNFGGNMDFKNMLERSRLNSKKISKTQPPARFGMDRGIGDPVFSASSYFMKNPPVQYDDSPVREEVGRFLRG